MKGLLKLVLILSTSSCIQGNILPQQKSYEDLKIEYKTRAESLRQAVANYSAQEDKSPQKLEELKQEAADILKLRQEIRDLEPSEDVPKKRRKAKRLRRRRKQKRQMKRAFKLFWRWFKSRQRRQHRRRKNGGNKRVNRQRTSQEVRILNKEKSAKLFISTWGRLQK